MKSQEQKGSLYAIVSGFLYGFIGYFGLSAMNGNISAGTMLFWRFLISSILILIILIPQIKTINDSYRSMFIAFLGGALYYGVSTLLYFYSSQYIGSGLAMVIFFTYPVMIMLLNFFFYGQSIPRIYYLATFIILMGMLLLIDMNEAAFDLLGISLGLISAFFYACYIITSKRNKISPTVSTLMVCLGCMMTSFFVALWGNTFSFPASATVWINLFGIGVVATVIPILLMLHSLKYISSEKASILSVLEPVFVVIFGVLLLGEELKPWHALGIVFVLSGALITLFSHRINLGQLKRWVFKITDA
ncbi:DMT family transporter [Legionella quateirensis]|uniref:Integral membrane protein n=1 Tax=Legionella quateirensis TaxID=45072 RepID=A0A378KZW4_9GAMM|nr:DMT family transporter [Legionella quateirensis]KTD51370.1 integral membrane protein [Legionella quateirensis]STY17380.1 permease, DMT superfamily [Legionella quateirensis]